MKNLLALLADWANGIFALLLAAWVTDTVVLWWYVPIALLLASLPDIDALPELLTRGRVAASSDNQRDHRTLLHWPVLALVICGAAVYVFGFWGYVTLFAVALHLLNDLYGTGWGIQLLWPFSTRRYKLLGRKVNRLKEKLLRDGDWGVLTTEERRLRFVVSWSHGEFPSYIKRWGYEDWIDQIYLRINWISGIEYALFIFACALLVHTLW